MALFHCLSTDASLIVPLVISSKIKPVMVKVHRSMCALSRGLSQHAPHTRARHRRSGQAISQPRGRRWCGKALGKKSAWAPAVSSPHPLICKRPSSDISKPWGRQGYILKPPLILTVFQPLRLTALSKEPCGFWLLTLYFLCSENKFFKKV